MRRALVYLLFFAVVLGGGLAIGSVMRPEGWYAALAKPPFNPPNWVFARVWTLLYAVIAVAGARTYERVILIFTRTRWSADRVSSLLFVPYAVWVAFATLLNAAIVVLN
jgi:benzodiazapine receptor